MRKSWNKKGLIAGIIILLFCSAIIPGISSKTSNQDVDEKTNSNKSTDLDQDTTSVTIYAFEETSNKKCNFLISSDDANAIYNKLEELIIEIKNNPLSKETQILKNDFVSLLDEKGLLQDGITSDDFLSLLNPSWLKTNQNKFDTNKVYSLFDKLIFAMKNSLFIRIIQVLGNRFLNFDPPSVYPGMIGTAGYSSIASFGYGTTHPFFIAPRPRIILTWNAFLGETYIGEIFTDKRLNAMGAQLGTALGFTGGGLSIGFPPANVYAFFGYAWFVSVSAKNVIIFP